MFIFGCAFLSNGSLVVLSPSAALCEQAGANGQSHAALFYPSMQAVWPEAYSTNNVRAVEVRTIHEYICVCTRLCGARSVAGRPHASTSRHHEQIPGVKNDPDRIRCTTTQELYFVYFVVPSHMQLSASLYSSCLLRSNSDPGSRTRFSPSPPRTSHCVSEESSSFASLADSHRIVHTHAVGPQEMLCIIYLVACSTCFAGSYCFLLPCFRRVRLLVVTAAAVHQTEDQIYKPCITCFARFASCHSFTTFAFATRALLAKLVSLALSCLHPLLSAPPQPRADCPLLLLPSCGIYL